MPQPIANGRRVYNPAFTVYSCDRGYVLSGVVARQCNENGTYVNEEPECTSELLFAYLIDKKIF